MRNQNGKLFEVGKYEKLGYEIFLEYPDFRKKYTSWTIVYQIGFLLGLINDYRFSNGCTIDRVLEIGVYNGVTSLYMLKVGCKRKDFELYGIDKGSTDFFGQAVYEEASVEELAHYHLYRNSTSFDIEKVLTDKKVDMVFIDGAHSHPHPILDLIHVIPFLHEESIVMFHDVVDFMQPHGWGGSFIYCAWKDKYRTVSLDNKKEIGKETTLGCISIPDNKTELYDYIEQIVKIPLRASVWQYGDIFLGIDESHINLLKKFMERYYGRDFAEKISGQFLENLKEYKEKWLLYSHETKFFNYLYDSVRDLKNQVADLQKKITT